MNNEKDKFAKAKDISLKNEKDIDLKKKFNDAIDKDHHNKKNELKQDFKNTNEKKYKDKFQDNKKIEEKKHTFKQSALGKNEFKDRESENKAKIPYNNENEFPKKPFTGIGGGRLKMVAVSGAEEIGMNMALYSYDSADGSKFTILVDCGISFDSSYGGAQVVMPDLVSLIEQGLKVDAIILTHGHEDHIGALPYLYETLDVPMYATPFTCGLIERKFGYIKLKDYALEKVNCGETRQIGPFSIKWIATTHSIPDSAMLAIEAGDIRVLHTGDWKLDPDPIVGPVTDHESLIAFGKKGIHALIGDSTNIHEEETANSEGEVAESLKKLIAGIKTGRVVLTCFASNVARVKSTIEAAKLAGRKVLILGTSLKKSIEVSVELGYLNDDGLIEEDEAKDLSPDQLMIICTGSQGEENSALWKISNKLRTAGSALEKGDTIIFSARVIDGRQHDVRRIINQLVERGVRVMHPWNSKDSCIHASGHPARPDIAQLWKWTKPNCVIPVHAEAEHRISHIAFAKEKGYRTHNLRNGHIIEITPDEIIKLDVLHHDKLLYDGNRLIPDHSEVFKQRKEMYNNGVVTVSCYYKNKKQVSIVTSYGLYDNNVDRHLKSVQSLSRLLKYDIERVIKKYSMQDFAQQENAIRKEVVNVAKTVVNRQIRKNPVIVCHILG